MHDANVLLFLHFVSRSLLLHVPYLLSASEVAGRFLCVSVHGGGGGSHVTITHDALDFTVQPTPRHQTMEPHPQPQPPGHQTWDPPTSASDIWWQSLQICSNVFI